MHKIIRPWTSVEGGRLLTSLKFRSNWEQLFREPSFYFLCLFCSQTKTSVIKMSLKFELKLSPTGLNLSIRKLRSPGSNFKEAKFSYNSSVSPSTGHLNLKNVFFLAGRQRWKLATGLEIRPLVSSTRSSWALSYSSTTLLNIQLLLFMKV